MSGTIDFRSVELSKYLGENGRFSINKREEPIDIALDPLQYITFLDIRHHEDISRLPIKRLVNLKILECHGCEAKETVDLNPLTALRHLGLTNTPNVQFDDVSKLTKVRLADRRNRSTGEVDFCDKMGLMVLPESVKDLSLQVADDFFIKSVACYTNLTSLSLSHEPNLCQNTPAPPIPDTFFNNTSLSSIQFNWEGLKEIPQGIIENPNLVSLSLFYSAFETIPLSLANSTSLTKLVIDQKSCREYEKYVYLNNVDTIFNIPNLKSLSVRMVAKDVVIDSTALSDLQELDIVDTELGWLSHFPYLKKLTVCINNVSLKLVIEKINQLQHLTDLKISGRPEMEEIDLTDLKRIHDFECLELILFKVKNIFVLNMSTSLQKFKMIPVCKGEEKTNLESIIKRNGQRHMELQKLALSPDTKD